MLAFPLAACPPIGPTASMPQTSGSRASPMREGPNAVDGPNISRSGPRSAGLIVSHDMQDRDDGGHPGRRNRMPRIDRVPEAVNVVQDTCEVFTRPHSGALQGVL